MLRKLISVLITVQLIISPLGISFAYPGGLVADYLAEMASYYYQMGNFKEVLSAINKLLLLEPDNEKAIKLIEQVKTGQEDPRGLAADFLFEVGKEYYQKGNAREALGELKRVLLILPNHKRARGLIEQIEREYPQMQRLIEEIKKIKPYELVVPKVELRRPKKEMVRPKELIRKKELRKEIVPVEPAKPKVEAVRAKEEVIEPEGLVEEDRIRLKAEMRGKQMTYALQEAMREVVEQERIRLEREKESARIEAMKEKQMTYALKEELEKRLAEEQRIRFVEEKEAARIRQMKEREMADAFKAAELKLAEKEIGYEIAPPELKRPAQVEMMEEVEPVEVVLEPKVKEPEERIEERIELVKPRLVKPRLKEEPEPEGELAMAERPREARTEVIKEPGAGLRAVINGSETYLQHPMLRREGILWVSLGDVAKELGVLVIPWKRDRFQIIRPDGDFVEIEINSKNLFKEKEIIGNIEHAPMIIDGDLVVSLDSLGELLGATAYWDNTNQVLYIDTEYVTSDMQTYSIPKPKTEAPIREKIYIPPSPPWQQVSKKPYSAGALTITPTIRHYHPDDGDITTDLEFDLAGHLYDYNFQGELEWEEENERQRFQRGYLEARKPGEHWRFIDNFLDLRPLSNQYESFRGVKFVKMPESTSPTTFFFGETENSVTGSGGLVEYDGFIFGVGKEYDQGESFKHKGMLIGTINDAVDSDLSGTTSYPENNFILFSDSTFYPWLDFSLSNQLGLCSYRPDDGNSEYTQDVDWRISSLLEKQKFSLSSSYEFVGDKYASLGNPDAYQDIQRWDVYYKYKLKDNWTISTGYGGSQDNVDDDSEKSTTHRDIFYAGTDFTLPTRQSVTLGWRRDESETKETTGDKSQSSGNSIMAIFRQPGRKYSLLGTYQHLWRDYSTATSDYTIDTLGLSLFRPLPKGSLNLGQQISLTDYKTEANDKKTYATNLGLSYRATPRWEQRFTTDYTSTENESSDDTYVFTFRYNTNYLWTRDIKSTFNYTKERSDGDWSENWSVLLIYSHPFEIVAPPRWGKVRGRVIQDLNNNYVVEAGEPGIAGVAIRLTDGSSAQTNQDGYYIIDKASPGIQRIFLDMAELPENLGPQGQTERDIMVKARGVVEVDFMAVELGGISGRLFIDANGNREFDSDEKGVEGVVVYLFPEEKYTRTLSDGTFYLDYVFPRKVDIGIKVDTLPEEYVLTSVDSWQLDLPVGGKLTDVNFYARIRLPEEMPEPQKPIIMQYQEKAEEE